jgi:hypothetical protein
LKFWIEVFYISAITKISMNPDGFDEYRSETLWPEIADHLDESPTSPGPGNKGIETVVDYLKMIVDDIPEEVAHWCESHSDARHIFTRYYPYSQQPVTFLLSNPRLDYNWDNPDKQIEHIEDDFPTLEHRRYAVTNQNDVRTLSQISAEHHNGYLYNDKGVECLLKRLGTVTETLNLSKVVRSLPEEDQWNRKRDEKNSGINSNDEGWKTYFYNPDTTRSTSLEDITETNPPKPTEVLEKLEGVTGKDRGLSAQSPDLDSGLFSDIYISNVYKLGSKGYPGPTNEDDHIRFTVQELRKAGSKLLIASGKPAQ